MSIQEHNPISGTAEESLTDSTAEIAQLLEESRRIRLADGAASVALAQQALALAENLTDYEHRSQYIEAHTELAAAAQSIGNHTRALAHILQAQALSSYHPSTHYAVDIHNVLGTVYISLGEYTKALDSLNKAQKLARSVGDTAAEAEILGNIGLTYGWLQNLDRALDAFLRALMLSEDGRMRPAARALLLGNLAYLYLLLKDYKAARSYARSGLAVAREADDLFNQVVILGNLSEIDMAEGEMQSAEQHLQEGRRISIASGIARLRTESLRSWARLHIARNETQHAIDTYEECLVIAEERGAKPVIEECLRGLSQLYEQQGNPARALSYLKSYGDVKDAFLRERVDMRISAMEESYRMNMIAQEREALQEKNALLEQLVQERNQSLATQQQLLNSIAELSTPVLPLLPDVLVVPLIGILDHGRVTRMHEQLLTSVAQSHARVLLIDITGVPIVDSQVASSLIIVVDSARLLGCDVIMVGIRPEIAQALVGLGVNLSAMTTRASLADGLRTALNMIGRKITAKLPDKAS